MSYYTVRQIAHELAVSEETVRRWIRAKLLPAQDSPGSAGWRVTAEAYQSFKAKYRGTTLGVLHTGGIGMAAAAGAAMGSLLPGIGTTIGGLVGAVLGGLLVDKREITKALVSQEAEMRLREAELETLKAHVRVKEAELAQIQATINALKTTHQQ